MKVMERSYQRVEQEMKSVAADMIFGYGVPTDLDTAHELADQMYPELMAERRRVWAEEVEAITRIHPDMEVAEIRPYPATATRKMVVNSAGLAPKPKLARVEMFDPETMDMQMKSVAPYLAPDNEAMQVEMARRLATSSARHIKQASRDVVPDTAYRNQVGWARQLTGKENCSFCAMLASRGAVYTEDTALTKRDGSKYHDHCDCTATLVVGGPWEGMEQAEGLYTLWKKSGDMASFGRKFREEFGFVGMAAT